MERIEIAPGVFVTDVPGEKFKKCRISVHFILPSTRESATAMALLPHVLDRRCAQIPDPTQLSRRLFGLYGADLSSDSYTLGMNRVFSMGISGMKSEYALQGENLEQEYTDLLCQLLFHPFLEDGVFASEDVAIEKEKQEEFLRGEMNDKRSYCIRQARRKSFGDSPLGIESGGYLEDLPTLDGKKIYEAYEFILAKARVEIIAVGANGEKAAKAITACLPKDRAPQEILAMGTIEKQQPLLRFTEPMDSTQGKLCIVCTSGVVAGVEEDMQTRVAAALFGGLPTSRLFMNVREKQSLCYYCSSGYNAYSGTLFIDSGINHADAEKTASAIYKELTQIQQELITQEELDNALLVLEGSYTSANDSPDALAAWVLNEELRGSRRSLEQAISMLKSVTREQVQQAMANFVPSVEYVLTQKEEA